MSTIFSSSIGKKLIMSISGLFLIAFLVVHLSVNLVLLFGYNAADPAATPYNVACHFMDTNIAIQIMVPILALGFLVHILYASIITLKNQKGRPVSYAVNTKTKASSWGSRNMYVLGFIVLGLIVLHLVNFWSKMQLQHFIGGKGWTDPYQGVVALFRQPVYSAIYVIWIIFLWFHLTHGFWSAFQTVGVNNSIWLKRWKCIANIFATLVCLGFAVIPLWFLFGVDKIIEQL